jgi:hypothetical protein
MRLVRAGTRKVWASRDRVIVMRTGGHGGRFEFDDLLQLTLLPAPLLLLPPQPQQPQPLLLVTLDCSAPQVISNCMLQL